MIVLIFVEETFFFFFFNILLKPKVFNWHVFTENTHHKFHLYVHEEYSYSDVTY